MGSTWLNVLIVIVFAAVIGALCLWYLVAVPFRGTVALAPGPAFVPLTPLPPGTSFSAETTILDKERGRFTARVSMTGDALPDIILGLDGTEAAVPFDELRRSLTLSTREDTVVREIVETWQGLSQDEKSDALGQLMEAVIHVITEHPDEVRDLILKRAGQDAPKGAGE